MGEVAEAPLISVVDDDEGVRRSLDGLVRSLGYRVAAFACAEDFLASPDRHRCACIISDVQMPGMSGIEMTAALGEAGSRVPVILISALPDRDTRAQADAAGAYDLFRKPFDGDALVDCLDHALAA
ncbi:response regulator [Roseomonas sp. SG15]|uniref:Response regulator n=1 Tax=Roseomonas indoligenes TaxID=2820811 RepID=A0A940N1R1_9PROT|nr:response regulator [Pararoseomonas indoligenes]